MNAQASPGFENRFYAFLRGLAFVCMLLAGVALLYYGIQSAYKLAIKPAVVTKVYTPSFTYDDFIHAAETPGVKATDTTQVNQSLDFENNMKRHLSGMYANLLNYSTAMGMDKPDDTKIEYLVRTNWFLIAQQMSPDVAWKYVESLEAATGDLLADAPHLVKLPAGDVRRIRWDYFVYNYTVQFKNRVDTESKRFAEDLTKAAADKAEGYYYLSIAGAALSGLFVAFFLMLLTKIERNTRPQ